MSRSYMHEEILGIDYHTKDTPEGYIPLKQTPVKNYDEILLIYIQTKIRELKELFDQHKGRNNAAILKMLANKTRETCDDVADKLFEIESDMKKLIEHDS